MQAEEQEERAALEAELAGWKAQQAEAAVGESRQRAARTARLARLKAGVSKRPEAYGVNPSVLDYVFLDPVRGTAGTSGGAGGGGGGGGRAREADAWPAAAREGTLRASAAGLRRRGRGQAGSGSWSGGSSSGSGGARSGVHSGVGPGLVGLKSHPVEEEAQLRLEAVASLPQPPSSSLLTDYEREMYGEESAAAPTALGPTEPPGQEPVEGQGQGEAGTAVPEQGVSPRVPVPPPQQQPQQQQPQQQQQQEILSPQTLASGAAPALAGAPSPSIPLLLSPVPGPQQRLVQASSTRAAAAGGTPPGAATGWGLWQWLKRRLRRMDRESYIAYLLFVAAFLADCSLLLAVLPLSLFVYALVSVRPSRRYWQVGCCLLPARCRLPAYLSAHLRLLLPDSLAAAVIVQPRASPPLACMHLYASPAACVAAPSATTRLLALASFLSSFPSSYFSCKAPWCSAQALSHLPVRQHGCLSSSRPFTFLLSFPAGCPGVQRGHHHLPVCVPGARSPGLPRAVAGS